MWTRVLRLLCLDKKAISSAYGNKRMFFWMYMNGEKSPQTRSWIRKRTSPALFMSCHEREALTLHHENGPVSRGTAAHGQFDTLSIFQILRLPFIKQRFCCNRGFAVATSLRRTGLPLAPSTYCSSTPRGLAAPHARLAPPLFPSPILWGRAGWGTTNRHA